MSLFVYQAVRPDGARSEGEVEAATRGEAFRQLEALRLQPLSVRLKGLEGEAVAPAGGADAVDDQGPRLLSSKQIVHFTDEMSDLLDAGLRLEPALRLMAQRRELSGLKVVIGRLRHQVVEGASFSSALRKASTSFGELYCRLVEAGELSGALPQILRRQAAYLMAMEELRNRVIQALIYPAIMCVVGFALMGVFMLALVPQLVVLFSKTGQQLPLLTRGLIAASNFAGHWWWLVLLLLVIGVITFWQAVSQPRGRLWWDRARLRIPLVGDVMAARYYVQFSQTLATMVGNGIPLLNALRLMHSATANRHLHALVGRVVDIVSEGGSLSRALQKVGDFPPTLIDMISVGEQTGDLGAALEKVGARYDKELDVRIQRMTAVIQPAIIVVMAVVVGVVAYSMITGIFQAVSGLKTR